MVFIGLTENEFISKKQALKRIRKVAGVTLIHADAIFRKAGFIPIQGKFHRRTVSNIAYQWRFFRG